MEVALEILSLGELLAVAARRRHSRRRCRNAWTAVAAVATAHSVSIVVVAGSGSRILYYIHTYSVLPARRRRVAPTCARRRFSISRVYIYSLSLSTHSTYTKA